MKKIGVFFGLIFFGFCSFQLVLGQESVFVESVSLLECKVQLPDDYNFDTSVPLLIGLHGGGGSYESFKDIGKHFDSPQFIFAVPEAPYEWMMEGKIGYDWSAWPTGDLKVMAKALKHTSDYIVNIIQSLTDKYNISEVYLLGFSQGSIIAQIAGIKNQKLLSGLIIFSGAPLNEMAQAPWSGPFMPDWPSEKSLKKANTLKIFMAHGKTDPLIDIKQARKSEEHYKGKGYETIFFEFDGGHEVNKDAMKAVQDFIGK